MIISPLPKLVGDDNESFSTVSLFERWIAQKTTAHMESELLTRHGGTSCFLHQLKLRFSFVGWWTWQSGYNKVPHTGAQWCRHNETSIQMTSDTVESLGQIAYGGALTPCSFHTMIISFCSVGWTHRVTGLRPICLLLKCDSFKDMTEKYLWNFVKAHKFLLGRALCKW